ncbi:hypothetical protein N0V84_005048 [Fusarium piperis]|uniref:Uncharacterized protein n=1 Tax=Fusarium piperis TaxID=1435070 RepID=A0A9W8WEH7_9HYPO|nr:hypothetical protein N0V84_005048 [Fusarium piperis]
MLGKVISNRDSKRRSLQDAADLLAEAQGLHQALAALKHSIEQTTGYEAGNTEHPLWSAIAICVSAQSLLHSSYGCPDAPGAASRARLALETEMQGLSVESLRVLASFAGPKLAQIPTQCPFLAKSFYDAATACEYLALLEKGGTLNLIDAEPITVNSL